MVQKAVTVDNHISFRIQQCSLCSSHSTVLSYGGPGPAHNTHIRTAHKYGYILSKPGDFMRTRVFKPLEPWVQQ